MQQSMQNQGYDQYGNFNMNGDGSGMSAMQYDGQGQQQQVRRLAGECRCHGD